MKLINRSMWATLACVVAIAPVSGCARKQAASSDAEPAGKSAGAVAADAAADVLYVGGDIVTVNDAQPSVDALAVKDGRILAVGSRGDVESAHKGEATKVVDLGGKALLPAFIDSHGHYINSLTVATQAKVYPPPAGPGGDVESIIAAIDKFRVEHSVP
jgi:hypothetical protein